MAEYDHSMQVETEKRENHGEQHSTSNVETYAIQEEQKETRNYTQDLPKLLLQNIPLFEYKYIQ